MTDERDLPLPEGVPAPANMCDGGDLDCGSGLLLIIRKHMQAVPAGDVLEVRSREPSVREDLPAWCRLVGHTMLSDQDAAGGYVYYFLRRKGEKDAESAAQSGDLPSDVAADLDADLDADLAEARDYAWQVRVRWTGGMLGKAFARNHSFPVGQPASFDTEDPAPAAIEYLLGAVGGALAVGFQWRLSQRGIQVQNLEVNLKARSKDILAFLGLEDDDRTDIDPSLAGIEGRVFVDADSEDGVEDDVLEALFEETMRRCPVTRSLSAEVPMNIQLRRT